MFNVLCTSLNKYTILVKCSSCYHRLAPSATREQLDENVLFSDEVLSIDVYCLLGKVLSRLIRVQFYQRNHQLGRLGFV